MEGQSHTWCLGVSVWPLVRHGGSGFCTHPAPSGAHICGSKEGTCISSAGRQGNEGGAAGEGRHPQSGWWEADGQTDRQWLAFPQ